MWRPIKFTPERMDQIRNLVERGLSREEIAETMGSTIGSLQVTCSKLGISLRKPGPRIRDNRIAAAGNGGVVEMESDNHNNGQTPSVVNVVRNKEETANIVISFRKKIIAIDLPISIIAHLSLDANISGLKIEEVIIKKLML
jgi:hypothetical protein